MPMSKASDLRARGAVRCRCDRRQHPAKASVVDWKEAEEELFH